MLRSLYSAATGMIAQQTQIDVTSNNIANVNTIGYKKQRAEFADLMYQTMEYAGTSTSSTTNVTGLDQGPNTLRWTVDFNGCVSTDEISSKSCVI